MYRLNSPLLSQMECLGENFGPYTHCRHFCHQFHEPRCIMLTFLYPWSSNWRKDKLMFWPQVPSVLCKIKYWIFREANNNGADQTAQMCGLIGALVCCLHKTVVLWLDDNSLASIGISVKGPCKVLQTVNWIPSDQYGENTCNNSLLWCWILLQCFIL